MAPSSLQRNAIENAVEIRGITAWKRNFIRTGFQLPLAPHERGLLACFRVHPALARALLISVRFFMLNTPELKSEGIHTLSSAHRTKKITMRKTYNLMLGTHSQICLIRGVHVAFHMSSEQSNSDAVSSRWALFAAVLFNQSPLVCPSISNPTWTCRELSDIKGLSFIARFQSVGNH